MAEDDSVLSEKRNNNSNNRHQKGTSSEERLQDFSIASFNLMETPAARRSFCQRSPSTPATNPDSAIRSFLNQVLLHDWWLIRADSDSHGKRIGIGGFPFTESRATRRFSSAAIVKRINAFTLKTVDDITIVVLGALNKSESIQNGFSREVCEHFEIGFPYYWDEFADLSVCEERADKISSPGDHGTNTFDSTPSSEKEEALQPINSMVSVDHKTTNTKKKRSDSSNAERTDTFDCTPLSEKKETLQPVDSMASVDHNTANTKKKREDSSNTHSGPWTRSSARRITRSMRIHYEANA